jgi:hypothetical protein
MSGVKDLIGDTHFFEETVAVRCPCSPAIGRCMLGALVLGIGVCALPPHVGPCAGDFV